MQPEHEQKAPDGAVGQRVAVQRKLAGMTQYQLADRAHVSASLVSQVERGAVPASPAFTATVARALRIDVEALTGEPYGHPITDPKADHAGIPALRAALGCVDDPEPSSPPMTAADLRIRLDQCDHYRIRSRYAQMAAVLPELLQHAYVIAAEARPGRAAETAWALLDDTYACVHTVAYRLGYLDLAALADERSRHIVEHAGDPLRVAASAIQRVYLRLRRGEYPGVLRAMERAHSEIADERGPTADAVRTALHLRQAITHARSGDGDRADEHIAVAGELVALEVPVHPYYNVR
ncbi:MAG: helix-turn-helix domain-containing protein, partial [Pseudonocardiaceae bacterium]